MGIFYKDSVVIRNVDNVAVAATVTEEDRGGGQHLLWGAAITRGVYIYMYVPCYNIRRGDMGILVKNIYIKSWGYW